jgi:2-keto-4-pentenoate hydratase/2-oxohepta-3-ene-1,7-dioic acid hydratase in catechol pathway
MKIIRYANSEGKISYGSEEPDGSRWRIEGDIFDSFSVTKEPAQVAELLAPVAPTAMWCIGQNYRQHADEVGFTVPDFPVVFAKGVNALQSPEGPVLLPANGYSIEVDYEGELVVIIGKACKNVPRDRALDYVAGYTCGNDVSARDWQLKWGGTQWCRGKSFDTFAPLGPCLVTAESLPDPTGLRIQTLLNGTMMQDGKTSDMIFDVPALVEFLSRGTTLLPGTAIFTGTPHGVGMARKPPRWLVEGDEISVVIENIGTLTNRVHKEEN